MVHEHSTEFEEARGLMGELETRVGRAKAQNFLDLFGKWLPLVEEANMMAAEMRPHDGLRFAVEVCSDVMHYTSEEPELMVRLYQKPPRSQGQADETVTGIFEMSQFQQRLEHIREVYATFKAHPDAVDLSSPGEDPWATYSFLDVQHIIHDARRQVAEADHRSQISEDRSADSLDAVGNKQRELARMDELQSLLVAKDAKIAELQRGAGRSQASASSDALLQQKERRIMELEMELQQLKAAQQGVGSAFSPASRIDGRKPGSLEAKLKHAGEESIAAAQLATKLLMSLQEVKEDLESENRQIENLRKQMSTATPLSTKYART